MKKELLSFIIPCYRSQKTVSFVIDEIITTIKEREDKYDYEIIAVNDHSPDKVWEVLFEIAKENKKIKLIDLAKNMNKPSALMAGFSQAKGDIVVFLDDDGQCPANKTWDLIQPLYEGYDAAIAKYPKKKQSNFKNLGSKINSFMAKSIINKPKDLQISNFVAVKKYIIKEIIKYKNPYPYFSGLLLRTTSNVINVPMEERNRISGTTGFTFKKMLSVWMNGFTAFSIKPLRIATILGVFFAIAGFIFCAYTIVRKIVLNDVAAGYSSIMAMLLFIGGVIMLLLGMIGEYIGRIYISINNSPQYVIRQTVNIDEEKSNE